MFSFNEIISSTLQKKVDLNLRISLIYNSAESLVEFSVNYYRKIYVYFYADKFEILLENMQFSFAVHK